MEPLAHKSCVPCRAGVPPLDRAAVDGYLARIDGWLPAVDNKRIEKTFGFPDFAGALAFTNAVGAIAQAQDHHPDLHLSWGRLRVEIWTHMIDGLTESDFILAAKIDAAHAGAAR